MIRSMTGVGRAEIVLTKSKVKLVVEIRSANHKFLDLNMKLPTPIIGYESEIRKLVSKKVFRGSLQLMVNIQGINNDKNIISNQNDINYNRALTLDNALLVNLLALIKKLKENYKIEGNLNVNTVLTFPGLVVPAKQTEKNQNKEIWQQVKKTIINALTALNKMKSEEGAFLYKDFIKRIATTNKLLKNIERRSKTIRQDLKEKIIPNQEQGTQLELLNAARTTTEELVRLSSHTRAFLRAIKTKKVCSIGRKLEFILSEMLRETETILAKGRDTLISRDGIAIKEEVDALREQVRNVE